MPRQNLYVKDGRSRTTSIRVNPLLYDAVRQQGGNVEDLFETALSAYLHVPPEVLVRLHREEELLEHCYDAIRAGQEEALARELARVEGERQKRSEADAARREMLAAVYAEMCSFPESGRRRVEQDIADGGECLYEEKLVMLLMRRLHYPENTIRGGVGVIVRDGWRVPEE